MVPDAEQGEFACARKFYDFVSETCEGIIQRGRADPPTSTHGTASRKVVTSLARDEACWMVRATFGAASMELREYLRRRRELPLHCTPPPVFPFSSDPACLRDDVFVR